MKKFLAWLIDLLWFLALVIWVGSAIFVYYLKLTGNLLDIPGLIQSSFNGVLLWIYFILISLILFYFVIIPYLLGGTLGQLIMGIGIAEGVKVDPLKIFLYYITVPIISVLFLPLVLYLKIRKVSFATKLSRVYVEKRRFRPLLRIMLMIFFVIMLVFTVLGIVIIKQKGGKILTRFIDYRRYADQAVKMKDYRTLASILPQYEAKYGKDANYWVYYCISEAMNGSSLKPTEVEDICKRAIYTNMDKGYHYAVLLSLINIYKNEDNDLALKKTYKSLWGLGYRGPEMLEFIKLSAAESTENAVKMLEEWLAANNLEKLNIQNISAVAELYLELKEYNKAKELFEVILNKSNEKSTKAAAYFKIGECYYFLKKYKLAKQYLLKAKELDEHYTNLVESYIIDMSLKGYK